MPILTSFFTIWRKLVSQGRCNRASVSLDAGLETGRLSNHLVLLTFRCGKRIDGAGCFLYEGAGSSRRISLATDADDSHAQSTGTPSRIFPLILKRLKRPNSKAKPIPAWPPTRPRRLVSFGSIAMEERVAKRQCSSLMGDASRSIDSDRCFLHA